MKLVKSLVRTDKNVKSSLKIELRNNLFFLLFVPLAALALCVGGCFLVSDFYFEAEATLAFTDYTVEEISSFVPALLGLFGTGMAAIMVYKNYRFLYNRRKVDFYAAFPVSRNTQIFSKSVVSLLSIVLSFVVSTAFPFFFRLFLRLRGIPINFNKTELVLSSLITMLSVIASYFLFQLIAVCAGRGWHYLLLLALSAFADNGLSLVFRLPSEQISGLGMKSASLASAFLPAYAIAFVPSPYGIGYGTVACGLVAVCVLLYFLGVYHYGKRPHECAQSSLSTPFIVAFLGGGTAMSLFAILKTPRDFLINILIGVGAGFVLFVLLCLIFYKKAFKKIFLVEYGILSACMILLVAVCGTNGFGWSNRLPAVEQVEYVTVKDMVYLETPSDSLLTHGDYFLQTYDAYVSDGEYSYYTEEEEQAFTLAQKESVQTVMSVNRMANEEFRLRNTQDNTSTLLFEYHLKGGGVRTRHLYYSSWTEEDITYFERIAALKEARESLVKKYDLKKYSPVISFGNLTQGAKMRINDDAMLEDIYTEYLAMTYDQALLASNANIDNMHLSIAFTPRSQQPPKDVENEWYGNSYDDWVEDSKYKKNITFSLLPSCKKSLKHCLRLNGISGFASLEEVRAENVDMGYKVALEPDYYAPFWFSEETSQVNDDVFWLDGKKARNENVFGRYCLSGWEVGLPYPVEKKEDSKTLQTILRQIDTSASPQIDDNYESNYAIYFLLDDGRITPLYFIKGAPLLFAEREETEMEY